MATKSTVPTVANGDSWSAAQQNTYLRDNIEAVWPYTTAGDLSYASAANQLTRLALGTTYKFLQAGASAPEWGGLHYAQVLHNTTQNVSTGSATVLAFNTDGVDAQGWHNPSTNNSRITVGVTGYYQASIYLEYATSGGSGTYFDTVELRRNGTVVFDDRRYQEVSAFNKKFSITFPIFQLTAGQYVEIYLEQNSGLTAVVAASARFSLWRVE